MALNAHPLAGWDSPRVYVPRLAVHLPNWLTILREKAKKVETCVGTPPLASGERVLLSVCDASERAVVVTDRAFYHQDVFPRAVDDKGWKRLPWELVGQVTWHSDRRTLTLTGLVPTISPTVLAIRDGAETALLARERVESTSLIQTRVDLGDHGSLRVLARRTPGTGHVVWVVALDDGTDVHAPAVKAAVHAALARLGAGLGLPSSRTEISNLQLRRDRKGSLATESRPSATVNARVRTSPGTRGDTYAPVAS